MKTTTEQKLAALKTRTVNPITRAIARDGAIMYYLSIPAALELDDGDVAWIRETLGCDIVAFDDGVSIWTAAKSRINRAARGEAA